MKQLTVAAAAVILGACGSIAVYDVSTTDNKGIPFFMKAGYCMESL